MKILAKNRSASFEYHLKEKIEAGIVLTGQEVKSIRRGNISLKGSYISLKDNELYLIGAHIPPYQKQNDNHQPERDRKLLLKKREIAHLIGVLKEKGLTLIPLKVYSSQGFIKVEIAIAKGKKLFDKRESIKKRDIDRSLKRGMH